jgi:UDP-N-acetylglucosamine:LPS N-acetylglucosamine transferase
MKNTRRTIEKLHPSLILNICSYVSESVFLALARLRRVSKIFNIIFNNENVIEFFSEKDFGISNMPLTKQEQWCERYISFKETFLYYKEIKYTVLIPQNSIKEDIEKAVDFINEVYKRTFALKSINFGYFQLVNRFMKHHRIVLAL